MGIQNYVAAAQANNNFARTLQAVQAGSPNYSDITRAGAMANLENELLARQLEGDMVVNATNAHGAVSVGKARAAIEEGKVLREQQRQKMAGRIAAQARRDRRKAMKPKPPKEIIPQTDFVPPDFSEIYDEIAKKRVAGIRKVYGELEQDPALLDARNLSREIEMGELGLQIQDMEEQLGISNTSEGASPALLKQAANLNNGGKLLAPISLQDARNYAMQAGASPQEANTLAAIAAAESRLIPNNDTIKSGLFKRAGETSYGLWQINMTGDMGNERLKQFGINSVNDLYDPLTNAKAAVQMMRNRGGFGDWTTYNQGLHLPYMQ